MSNPLEDLAQLAESYGVMTAYDDDQNRVVYATTGIRGESHLEPRDCHCDEREQNGPSRTPCERS